MVVNKLNETFKKCKCTCNFYRTNINLSYTFPIRWRFLILQILLHRLQFFLMNYNLSCNSLKFKQYWWDALLARKFSENYRRPNISSGCKSKKVPGWQDRSVISHRLKEFLPQCIQCAVSSLCGWSKVSKVFPMD